MGKVGAVDETDLVPYDTHVRVYVKDSMVRSPTFPDPRAIWGLEMASWPSVQEYSALEHGSDPSAPLTPPRSPERVVNSACYRGIIAETTTRQKCSASA